MRSKLDQTSAQIFRSGYNPNGWLTNRWTPAKGTTTYKYDVVGNLTNVVYPAGTTSVTLKYDPLSRVTNMTDAVGTTLFGYTSGGLLASEDSLRLTQLHGSGWSGQGMDLEELDGDRGRRRRELRSSTGPGSAGGICRYL